jgi:tetratricopeptide (TPR) repeat protein
MSEINIFERFPEMEPVQSVPPLSTVNGIGFMMYGDRDSDPETGTYVKTLCFTLLFVPLAAVKAYRVANAPNGGWYFIGRVPLSGFARTWNFALPVVVASIAFAVFWAIYSGSEDYKAGQKLARADELAKEGRYGQAAERCREVAQGKSGKAIEARKKLKEIVAEAAAGGSAVEANAALAVAVDMKTELGPDPELAKLGLAAVDRFIDNDPRGAGTILETITPVEKEPEKLLDKKRDIWERVVAAGPDDPDAASQLAVVYEAQNEPDKCEKVLSPVAKRLETREGARILGHIYTQQNKLDEANALLQPYLQGRLERMRKAEKVYEHAIIQARDQAVEQVNKGKAADFPVERHRHAPEAEKRRIEEEYLREKTKNNHSIQDAHRALVKELSVVPVAIDYGIVQLRRAQTMRDEAQRRAELEKAKQTFLSIKGVAGEDDAYRLYLGQVHYWLGEHAEGRKLIDELLKARNRSFEIVSIVVGVLREVGAVTEARTLAEEAYGKETSPEKKQVLARTRSVMHIDLDDEIKWLRLCKQSDDDVQGSLNTALGRQAHNEGKDKEAAEHLQRATECYARMPETTASLNNGARAYFILYGVTGDSVALEKATAMLDKAIATRPDDTIILSNAAGSVLGVAVRDLIGSAIDLKLLRKSGEVELLAYLYSDEASKQKLLDRMRKHSGMNKARTYYERLMVLSPKQIRPYAMLFFLNAHNRDTEALRAILKRVRETELDLSDLDRHMRDRIEGKDTEKRRSEAKANHDRAASILQTAREMKDATTRAVAAVELAKAKQTLAELSLPADLDEMVKLNEEAYTSAPSVATRGALTNSLLSRASIVLEKQEPAYAAMVQRTKRNMYVMNLLAIAADRDEKVRAAVSANPDVKRALTLLKQSDDAFPKEPGPATYWLLRALKAPEAAELAQRLNTEYEKVEKELEIRLNPLSADTAFSAYFFHQACGEEAKGIEILKQCAGRGVPLPFDP